MFDLKEKAKDIWLKALQSADIKAAIQQRIQLTDEILFFDNHSFNMKDYNQVLVIGFGKASVTMGAAIESLFGQRITEGILVTNRQSNVQLKSAVLVAGHPFPNKSSLLAGKKIIDILRNADAHTLLLFLISGGGSSLVELPEDRINLSDLRATNQLLVNSGAAINEINMVRKGLSKIKGGKLKQFLKNSTSLAIYISDVNPGDLASLASGPLIDEESQVAVDVSGILEKYQLTEKLPGPVYAALMKTKLLFEKEGSAEQQKAIQPILLLENLDIVRIAARLAEEQGFVVETLTEPIDGFYRDVADELFERVQHQLQRFPDKTVCVISGGEASCPVDGKGIGGRNQELVLYSAAKLAERKSTMEVAILSCGTDGIDGISWAAGAVSGSADGSAITGRGLEVANYLVDNDATSYLKQAGGLVITGPSGNNVRDLIIVLARPGVNG